VSFKLSARLLFNHLGWRGRVIDSGKQHGDKSTGRIA
jgi:hypothetical protein